MEATVVAKKRLHDAANDLRGNDGDAPRVDRALAAAALAESVEAQLALVLLLALDVSCTVLALLVDPPPPMLAPLLEALAGFALVAFALELALLLVAFRGRFFAHAGYALDAGVVVAALAYELYARSKALRLLGVLRLWRVGRLVNTLVERERSAHDATRATLESEQLKVLQLEAANVAARESLRREYDSRGGLEQLLQRYKDEVETLKEALQIAAEAVAEAELRAGATPLHPTPISDGSEEDATPFLSASTADDVFEGCTHKAHAEHDGTKSHDEKYSAEYDAGAEALPSATESPSTTDEGSGDASGGVDEFQDATLENAFYMASFLAAKAVPVVAASASVVFAVQTVASIRQAKSTLQFSFEPFFFYFVSSVIYTLYAFATANTVMGATALLGVLLGSYYVSVYYTHAGDKTQPARMLALSLLFVVLLALAVSRSPDEAQLIIGVPANVLSVLTAASPLLQIRSILRLRDASCLPFGMSFMNVVAGGTWMVYGLMLRDPLVVLPNLFALSMGIIQVSLILLYPGPGATKGHGRAKRTDSEIAAESTPLHFNNARGRTKSEAEKA